MFRTKISTAIVALVASAALTLVSLAPAASADYKITVTTTHEVNTNRDCVPTGGQSLGARQSPGELDAVRARMAAEDQAADGQGPRAPPGRAVAPARSHAVAVDPSARQEPPEVQPDARLLIERER